MNAPDRIYGWLDSQLSIARYYGGCTYQGESYVVDHKTAGCPLVKKSVLAEESKLLRKLSKRKQEVQAGQQKELL